MSESDSFINEVTEEVRRERLFGLLRRYGWIAVVVVIAIVGAATWNEVRKANARGAAQAFGDQILDALALQEPEARAAALADLPADAVQAELLALLTASERTASGDPAAAADVLRPLAASTEIPAAYSDMAALKLVMLGEDGVDETTRAQLLERLSQPGAPYRVLALEQQAVALAAAGDAAGARAAAEALLREPDLTQGIITRISQLMIALPLDPTSNATDEAEAPAEAEETGQ